MKSEYKKNLKFYILVRWIFLVIYALSTIGLVAFCSDEVSKSISPYSFDVDGFPDTRTKSNNLSNDVSRSGLVMPSENNFQRVSAALSASINQVNVMQEGQTTIDSTDLTENFDNFSYSKYQAVINGERHYKYLQFEKYWHLNQPRVKAYVSVRDSHDGRYALEYVNLVLDTLKNRYKIDTSRVTSQDVQFIARDVSELGRFTCIKFLRLVWALFSNKSENRKGLFPQVYQMQVVDAGELATKVEGGVDIFSQANKDTVQSSQVSFANISNSSPEKRVKLFDNKVVVFFRPTYKQKQSADNGHVGVGKLNARYDVSGSVAGFTISFVEVNGFTGQATYQDQMDLNEFRSHLYFNMPSNSPIENKTIGWFINR